MSADTDNIEEAAEPPEVEELRDEIADLKEVLRDVELDNDELRRRLESAQNLAYDLWSELR